MAYPTDVVPDTNMREVINTILGVTPTDSPISSTQMESLTGIVSITGENITNIEGMQYGININQLNLYDNEIVNISPIRSLTQVERLDLVNNKIANLSGLSKLSYLEASNQNFNLPIITVIRGLTVCIDLTNQIVDFNGDVPTILIISPASATYDSTVHVLTIPTSGEVDPIIFGRFNFNSTEGNKYFNGHIDFVVEQLIGPMEDVIPDLNLRSILNTKYFSSPALNPISATQMKSLNGWVYLNNGSISSIEGIQYGENIEQLYLSNNNISEIGPLTALRNIEAIILGGNKVSQLVPLDNMFGLRTLDLSQNGITDISVLSNLTMIYNLILSDNKISDISSLSNLIGVGMLELNGNDISDVNSLSNLPSLQTLDLSSNHIKDVSHLQKNKTYWINNQSVTLQSVTTILSAEITVDLSTQLFDFYGNTPDISSLQPSSATYDSTTHVLSLSDVMSNLLVSFNFDSDNGGVFNGVGVIPIYVEQPEPEEYKRGTLLW